MKNLWFFPLLVFVSLTAWARQPPSKNTDADAADPELRRAELRLALKPPVEREANGPGVQESGSQNRRLSERERLDMRQQLRQQPQDVRFDRR